MPTKSTLSELIFLLLITLSDRIHTVHAEMPSTRASLDHFIRELLHQSYANSTPSSCNVNRTLNFFEAGSSSDSISNMVWDQSITRLEVTHISKTGLTSFHRDIRSILNAGDILFSHEKCFEGAHQNKSIRLVFLRAPVRHIFSQFGHCYEGQFLGKIRPGFPQTGSLMGDYEAWLRHFVALNSTQVGPLHDFDCYDARDMQTRFMSCRSDAYEEAGGKYPQHEHVEDPANLQRALDNVEAADFIGLTDMYIESVCMFEVRKRGHLSDHCTCKARNEAADDQRGYPQKHHHHHHHQHNQHTKQQRRLKRERGRKSSAFSHIDHHVPHVQLEKLLQEPYLSMQSALTMKDRQLYAYAMLRFLCDLRAAEAYLRAAHPRDPQQHRILCSSTLTTLINELRRMGNI